MLTNLFRVWVKILPKISCFSSITAKFGAQNINLSTRNGWSTMTHIHLGDSEFRKSSKNLFMLFKNYSRAQNCPAFNLDFTFWLKAIKCLFKKFTHTRVLILTHIVHYLLGATKKICTFILKLKMMQIVILVPIVFCTKSYFIFNLIKGSHSESWRIRESLRM